MMHCCDVLDELLSDRTTMQFVSGEQAAPVIGKISSSWFPELGFPITRGDAVRVPLSWYVQRGALAPKR